MLKYAQIINQETKKCNVGTGTNSAFYKSIGMTLQDVEQSYTGEWYLTGYAPVKSLEELKTEKLIQISEEAGKYDQYKCDTMFIISSVDGLKINSDARSQNNIRALIEHYTDLVTFKTYDNNYVQLTKEQLETILTECILNGESLYAQKWALQDKVNNAQSKEDLDAIEIIFNMTDFSQSES